VNGQREFRTPEQEVLKLLEECSELRRTLKTISAQLGRMEIRVKRAFPAAAKQVGVRIASGAHSASLSISQEEALAEFDRIVRLAATGASEEAEKIVEAKSAADLSLIARELGVSFPKSKPSHRAMRDAIFGRVRESVLLSRHSQRA
jgi:hypothetical protein